MLHKGNCVFPMLMMKFQIKEKMIKYIAVTAHGPKFGVEKEDINELLDIHDRKLTTDELQKSNNYVNKDKWNFYLKITVKSKKIRLIR